MISARRDERFNPPLKRARSGRRRGTAVSSFFSALSGFLKPGAPGLAPAETSAGRSALDFEDIGLGFLLHDVSRLRRNAYDQFSKPFGVTRAQWWALAHLSRHDGMMQTELADVLEVGKSSLGDLIENLEAGNWVERRADPADKRAKRVFLTAPSRALIAQMNVTEAQFNAQVLRELSQSERGELSRMLKSIKRAIGRFDPADTAAGALTQ